MKLRKEFFFFGFYKHVFVFYINSIALMISTDACINSCFLFSVVQNSAFLLNALQGQTARKASPNYVEARSE